MKKIKMTKKRKKKLLKQIKIYNKGISKCVPYYMHL